MNLRYEFGGISINTVGVTLTPSIWEAVKRRIERITRRYPRLLGVKVDLKRDTGAGENRLFLARARLVLPGYDRIVEKSGPELYGVISKTMEVANRQLRKRNRERISMKRANRMARFI